MITVASLGWPYPHSVRDEPTLIWYSKRHLRRMSLAAVGGIRHSSRAASTAGPGTPVLRRWLPKTRRGSGLFLCPWRSGKPGEERGRRTDFRSDRFCSSHMHCVDSLLEWRHTISRGQNQTTPAWFIISINNARSKKPPTCEIKLKPRIPVREQTMDRRV